jgi:hypothetical protein
VDLGLFVGKVIDGEGDIESARREERPAAFTDSIEVLWDSWLYGQFVWRRCVSD